MDESMVFRLSEMVRKGIITVERAARLPDWQLDKSEWGYIVVSPIGWWCRRQTEEEYTLYQVSMSREAAEEHMKMGVQNRPHPQEGTCWESFDVCKLGITEDGEIIVMRKHQCKIAIDPEEPPCPGKGGHNWQAPYDIVGGCGSNPGVRKHGDGVICEEVCIKCGCAKLTDTWARDPKDGEEGLQSVRYYPDKYADIIRTKQGIRRK